MMMASTSSCGHDTNRTAIDSEAESQPKRRRTDRIQEPPHEKTSDGLDEEPGMVSVEKSNIAGSEHVLECKHKVFLSHSGAQKDFVEQLCVDLQRRDRYPFFDKLRSSLPIGEKFPELIFDGIKQCQVGVLVLSKEFFMSKWPMLELNAMVKEFEKPNTRMKLIPIFYGITLDDFKDTKNRNVWISWWEEWANDDKRIDVEEWKRALKSVESINSLKMREGMGDVKFREEILVEICGLVPRETRWDDSHVEGRSRCCKVIRDKMDEVSSTLRVGVVGLYGVRGIGKTTMCKALCNDLSSKFQDNVCHIEMGQGSEMKVLQKALKQVTRMSHEMLDKLDDVEEGYSYLKKSMRIEPVFMALDNVQDEYKTLQTARKYLKGGYGVGSVVLVTSHSLDVLMKLNLEEGQCMEMPELDEVEARSLFLNYTGLSCGIGVDEKLMKDCMELCHLSKGDGKRRHYHPLTLQVLGQQLGSNVKEWNVEVRKINAINELEDAKDAIFSIFRNSFDMLEEKQQHLFMDLALIIFNKFGTGWLRVVQMYNVEHGSWTPLDWLCMVYGESIEDMKKMLRVLKRRSFLEDLSDDFANSCMHDLWIEFALAQTKAQDAKNARWVYHTDEKGVGKRRNMWTKSVERMSFLNEGWMGLSSLKVNDFVNVEAFELDVGIHMGGSIVDLEVSGMKHMKSLKVQTIGLVVRVEGLSTLSNLSFLQWSIHGFSPCLDRIGCLTKLQFLWLMDCKGMKELDLTELKLLQVVRIEKFEDLITVRGLSSRMTHLRNLGILRCNSMQECLGLDEVYTLECLSLIRCTKLKELPCLRQLTNLKRFDIHDCYSIRAVPGLNDMVALEEFIASGCMDLVTIPDLVKLTNLQRLDIFCSFLSEVLGLDGLIALTALKVKCGKFLRELPMLSKLSALKDLLISGCEGPIWTSIQDLMMLETLALWNCRGEYVVPNLQNLKRLKSMELFHCDFKDLSGLGNLIVLESLHVHYCELLEMLPEFARLTYLSRLSIKGCKQPGKWPSVGDLCSLTQLAVESSIVEKFVPIVETSTGLRELELFGDGCENMLSIASLSQLQSLTIWHLAATEALDVSNFPHLTHLTLIDCSLRRLTCSTILTTLTTMTFVGCVDLEEIPDLSMFPQLECLHLHYCSSIIRLTCSNRLTALKEIELHHCASQIEIPELKLVFPKLTSFIVKSQDDSEDED